jgi:hypothetical protein
MVVAQAVTEVPDASGYEVGYLIAYIDEPDITLKQVIEGEVEGELAKEWDNIIPEPSLLYMVVQDGAVSAMVADADGILNQLGTETVSRYLRTPLTNLGDCTMTYTVIADVSPDVANYEVGDTLLNITDKKTYELTAGEEANTWAETEFTAASGYLYTDGNALYVYNGTVFSLLGASAS